MKTRARLIVKGDVQEVGYRAVVMKTAQKLGLSGYVENVPDGTVKIICEGTKEDMERFCKMITIKNDVMGVEEIDVEYGEATGEYTGFTVKIPDLGYELFQGFATAGKYFHNLGNKVDKGFEDLGEKVDAVGEKVDENIRATKEVGEKVDENIQATREVGEKVDTGFETLGNKVDNMHMGLAEKMDTSAEETHMFREETRCAFVELDAKYHTVSETLLSMNKSLKVTEERLNESVEELKKVVQKFLDS